MSWYPLWNSLRVALISCVVVFFLGIFAAYYVAKLPRAIKGVLDVVLTLPMVLPPTVVGFHGKTVTFAEDQMKLNESNGTEVLPGSLYEAQIALRLGYTPQWITDVKNGTTGISGVAAGSAPTHGKSYNMSGVAVDNGYEGIVIKDGKKTVNK